MANVNLSLDEIIKKKKAGAGSAPRRATGSGGGGRLGSSRRAGGGGGGGRDRYFSDDVPAGKWKHDKYFETYGGSGGKRAAVGGVSSHPGASGGARRTRGGGKEMVKLNISNLPSTVLTDDLEELFVDFSVYGVAVHYDEAGAHLGTATLFVAPTSAKQIVREFANVAIDGQEIKIGIVDESGGGRSAHIMDRIRRIGGGGSPQRRRGTGRRSDGGRVTKPSAGGRRGGPKKAPSIKAKKLTVEELDKELETYMNKAKE